MKNRLLESFENITTVKNNYWKTIPNRDEALEKVFEFLKSLSNQNPDEASQYILTNSMENFQQELHQLLKKYLALTLDDNEFLKLPEDLSVNISDPEDIEEESIEPEFQGKEFTLEKDEHFSLLVGFQGEATPIKITFKLEEMDEVYFLKLVNVVNRTDEQS